MTAPLEPTTEELHHRINQLIDDTDALRRRVSELESQLAAAAAGQFPERELISPHRITWSPIIAQEKNDEPMVTLQVGTHYLSLASEEVMSLAIGLLGAIVSAHNEAALLKFLRSKNVSEESAIVIATGMRLTREATSNKQPKA